MDNSNKSGCDESVNETDKKTQIKVEEPSEQSTGLPSNVETSEVDSIEQNSQDLIERAENKEEVEKNEEQPVETVQTEFDTNSTEKPPDHPPDSMQYIKIAKVPKEVLNFMVKEENGAVRINLTQLNLFSKELWSLGRYVNSTVWDSCDFPTLDMAVPKNALNHTIVQNFNVNKSDKMFEKIESDKAKYSQINQENYSKMSDEFKLNTWKKLNKTFKIENNVITQTSIEFKSPVAEKSPKKKKTKKHTSEIQPVEGSKEKQESNVPKTNDTPQKQPVNKSNRKRIMSPAPQQAPIAVKKLFVENSSNAQQQPQNIHSNQKNNIKKQFDGSKEAHLDSSQRVSSHAKNPSHSRNINIDRRPQNSWKNNAFPANSSNYNNRYYPTNAPGRAFAEGTFAPVYRSLLDPRETLERQHFPPGYSSAPPYANGLRLNPGYQERRMTFDEYSARNNTNNRYNNAQGSSSHGYYRSHQETYRRF